MKWSNFFSWSSLLSHWWQIYLLSLFLKYIFNGSLTFMCLLTSSTFKLHFFLIHRGCKLTFIHIMKTSWYIHFYSLIAFEKRIQASLYLPHISLLAVSVHTFSCLQGSELFVQITATGNVKKLRLLFSTFVASSIVSY